MQALLNLCMVTENLSLEKPTDIRGYGRPQGEFHRTHQQCPQVVQVMNCCIKTARRLGVAGVVVA